MSADPAFLTLAESSNDLVVRHDREGRYLFVNGAFEQVVGVRREDVLGRAPEDLPFSPELVATVRRVIATALGGAPARLERVRFQRAGGPPRWFEAVCVPERGPSGEVVAAMMIGRDVTDRVSAEAALEESEIRFRAVFEKVPVGMAVSTGSAHGYVTNANAALSRMLGYTPEELARMHFSEFTHPEDVDRDRRLLEQVQAGTRDSYSIEKRYFRKDGSVFWVHLTVSAVRDPDGTLRHVVGMTEDITERKEIEEELRASEERFRALVEHSSDLIAILELDGTVRYVSPSQQRLLGYATEEIAGMNALDLVHPDDRDRVVERLEMARRVGNLQAERPVRFRSRQGQWRSLMVTVTDMHENPAVQGFVVNARDVTRELRLQEQLTQSQKMEALGQLAGGVAHDFNNILAAISGYAELLQLELPPDSPSADDVREIARATARGAGVTKQLLAFSRRQTLETELLDLNAVIRETGRMLRALLPATIDLELPEADARPIYIRAARAQIEQVVLNLAVNARDAMPGGGSLRISLATRTGGDRDEAVLTVADTGRGMTEEVRARAFEPFFTTKGQGKGTGLGLSTVYGVVRQFGGRIELDSAPGVGTTFMIHLPLAEFEAEAAVERVGAPAPSDTGARILLAEDEMPLRSVLSRTLERAGYTVIAVVDGGAALAALHGGDAFDVLISDVAMPRLGGRELAAAVQAGWPDLPVILMSGYAELGATPEAGAEFPPNVAAFVEKPFEVERLLQLVAGVLAKRGQRVG